MIAMIVVLMQVAFCTRDYSGRSMDNYYFQQAIHLSDTMFSVDSMQHYYDDFFRFLKSVLLLDDFEAGSVRDNVFYDSLHYLMDEYNNGNPTRDFFWQIEKDDYVQGWKDCEPTLEEIGNMSPGQILDKSGYSHKYMLSDSVLYDKPAYLVDVIDRNTDSVIQKGKSRFGYSASREKYIGLMRY
jgi:hypothetical protein